MSTEAVVLQAIREKVEAGQRLSFEDGLALEESNDLFALGAMANLVRERYNGNFGYYNVNTHINPTNVCVYTCDFCAFRADLDDDPRLCDGPRSDRRAGRQAALAGRTELHIVGGLHHKLPFDYYVDVVRWIHDAYPEIHIKAYTGVEIEFFCKIARLSIERGPPPPGRRRTREPAGRRGRDLPSRSARPDLRAKASTETWLDVHRTAHRLGLHSNATMLYGHIDEARSTGSTTSSASASSRTRPAGSRRSSRWRSTPTTRGWTRSPSPPGVMDLKIMAISRLMLDNFPHIKAYWVMLGLKTAQVALSFGADDIDGTVVHEKIYHEAGAETPRKPAARQVA